MRIDKDAPPSPKSALQRKPPFEAEPYMTASVTLRPTASLRAIHVHRA